jgi:uncharacterized delta-60 repeat protein
MNAALQSDGKIIVSVSNDATNSALLVRYNSDGTLDAGFDGDGIVNTTMAVAEVIVQPDGKIVVAGTLANQFAIARYNADGTPDTSFAGDGLQTTDVGPFGDVGQNVAIQSDGKLVVAGRSYDGNDYRFALARYNTDGTLDTNFGNNGVVVSVGPLNGVTSLAIQPDDRILVGGSINSQAGSSDDFALARFNTDGSPDTTFGDSGIAITPVTSGQDIARSVTLQPDGKIVQAGLAAVVRYNADGSLDGTFEIGGLNASPAYTEGDAPLVLDGDLSIQDAELEALNSGSGDYAGASLTVAREGGANAEDDFGFDINGAIFTISGNNLQSSGQTFATFTSTGGMLTIDFTSSDTTATSALVDEVMQRIQYANTSNDPPTDVTLDWRFSDGNSGAQGAGDMPGVASGSTTVSVTAVNDAPVLTAGATLAYTENDPASVLDATVTVSDADDTELSGATVQITGDYVEGEDVLAFADTASIIGSFDAVTGTLTLSGADTLANYEAALRSVTYASTSEDPSGLARTVTFIADDGSDSSAPVTATIEVTAVDDPALAFDDSFAVLENAIVNGASSVFADNGGGADTDPDDPLEVTEVNGSTGDVGTQIALASGALLELNADGTFTYDPNGAFDFLPDPASGASNSQDTDTFTYTLNGDSTATVTVTVTGVDSDDILEGTAGDDTLEGGIGGDLLNGGDGTDTASYAGSDNRVVINLGLGYAASGHAQGDSFVSIENLIGSTFNDRMVGDGSQNRLWGRDGNDELKGGRLSVAADVGERLGFPPVTLAAHCYRSGPRAVPSSSIRARISATRQAVTRGESFTGGGYRPPRIPAHHVDRETGIAAKTAGRRRNPASGTPLGCEFFCRFICMSSDADERYERRRLISRATLCSVAHRRHSRARENPVCFARVLAAGKNEFCDFGASARSLPLQPPSDHQLRLACV